MLKPIFRVWNKGVTLVEMLVVLSIISFVLVGSLVLFGVVGEKQKVTTMTSNLAIISSAITSFYSTSADYTDLTATVLIKAGGLPTNIISGTTELKNPFGDVTVIASNAEGADQSGGAGSVINVSHYKITYTDIPNSACAPFVANALNSYILVKVGGVEITSSTFAATTCAAGNSPKTIFFVNK